MFWLVAVHANQEQLFANPSHGSSYEIEGKNTPKMSEDIQPLIFSSVCPKAEHRCWPLPYQSICLLKLLLEGWRQMNFCLQGKFQDGSVTVPLTFASWFLRFQSNFVHVPREINSVLLPGFKKHFWNKVSFNSSYLSHCLHKATDYRRAGILLRNRSSEFEEFLLWHFLCSPVTEKALCHGHLIRGVGSQSSNKVRI